MVQNIPMNMQAIDADDHCITNLELFFCEYKHLKQECLLIIIFYEYKNIFEELDFDLKVSIVQ